MISAFSFTVLEFTKKKKTLQIYKIRIHNMFITALNLSFLWFACFPYYSIYFRTR